MKNDQLDKQLMDSLYVHRPMAADTSREMSAYDAQKDVLASTDLFEVGGMECWSFEGEGEAELTQERVLVLKTGARGDHWPQNEARSVDAPKGHYATFGSYIAKLNLAGLSAPKGNRISFQIRPMCCGLHSPIIRVGFVNDGVQKIPDEYSREGFNAINLNNFEWNTCLWEIDSIPHDRLVEISFNVHRYGQELSGAEELRFELKDICLQTVETPNVVHGWQCERETAVYPTTGYWPQGVKTALANTEQKRFSVLNLQGEAVYAGDIKQVQGVQGDFAVLDFSPLVQEGEYRLHFGQYTSGTFRIDHSIAESTVWKLINFLYCERCGHPVAQKHGVCHGDILAAHNGVTIAYQGGWHDAADVSQQTIQTAEIAEAILEVAQASKGKNALLYARLLEEAAWGIDFVLRMRFGDGYRATGATIRRWTDGQCGNMDDCEARVHNRSFDNFVMAGVEAVAGMAFEGNDSALAWKCRDAAKADYAFALERFREVGLEEPYWREHTNSASLSQYYAAASWAASKLYTATGDEQYGAFAREFISLMLLCQERGTEGVPMQGFFYRDETQKVIVHFSHQGRDQIFMQALEAISTTQPECPQRVQWEESMRLYGDWLKSLMHYTKPYGMIPAGMFHESETQDELSFGSVHPRVDLAREKQHYQAQLKQGIALGNGYYVKCFPVWFSYRGNSAMHLSMGKAASLLARYFGDEELREIAREQLYWTLGKNPFGQSLIYGEGDRFGQQYTALLGETVGEIPVGVQTQGDDDLPYWPQANIATYREVWTTPVGRWLWIAGDLMQEDQG
ncbi:MAG: glycoside hydrolase [Clostridiales bacterium]|nr:glycoside hydrolase [Clostridiales bacterium]